MNSSNDVPGGNNVMETELTLRREFFSLTMVAVFGEDVIDAESDAAFVLTLVEIVHLMKKVRQLISFQPPQVRADNFTPVCAHNECGERSDSSLFPANSETCACLGDNGEFGGLEYWTGGSVLRFT